jgi:hypothetical protein
LMKIDSEFLNHALWRPHYRERDFRQKCAAETQAKRIVYPELVALGVSAEVVVVLKMRMRALPPVALRQKCAAERPLMLPPTMTRSRAWPVSSGLPAESQKVPSRRLCAVSNQPGWLPRRPVRAGG